MSSLVHKLVRSPVGVLRLVASDVALVSVHLPPLDRAPSLVAREVSAHDVLDLAARELDEYFRGERRAFATPLAPAGTDFQRAVWNVLATIPFGERRSYSSVASAIGRPRAVRAVGAANGQNPLPLFLPCHRVVGKDGSMTGYGGGVHVKRWLLAHEEATLRGSGQTIPHPGTRSS